MEFSRISGAARPAGVMRFPAVEHLIWLLLAATPIIFALVTWDPTGRQYDWQGVLRFLSIPVLAIEMLVCIYATRRRLQPLGLLAKAPSWMAIALAVLTAIAFGTALLVAQEFHLALIRTIAWLVHALFGFSITRLLVESRDRVPWLWSAIVAGTCGYVLLLVALVLSIPDPDTYPWLELGLGVGNVRQTGYYTIVGAGAALGIAAMAGSWRPYWAGTAAATLLLSLAFWSGSRGALVAVLAALSIGGVLLPALRSGRALVAYLLSFGGGALLSLLHAAPDSSYGLFRIGSSVAIEDVSSGRVAIWNGTWRDTLERPLFGYGESQLPLVVPEAGGVFYQPHNAILQMLFHWGFVGAACFFAIVGALLWRAYDRSKGRAEAAPALLVLAGLLTMSLYDGGLYHHYPVMMATLSLAYLLVLPGHKVSGGLEGA